MLYNYKSFDLEVKDIDRKSRVVKGYFSSFGNIDSQGDMIMPGAFKRSIQEWGFQAKNRIKHLQNHDTNLSLGKIIDMKEDDFGLYYESRIVETSFGTDFIKMVEGGLITEHSIGFSTLREQKNDDYNEIQEVKLYEGSSLTAWGANEVTPMLGFKSVVDVFKLKEEIRKFEKFIRHSDATDDTIDLCLIKVRQLAQAVETLSSTKASDKEPEQRKSDDKLETSLISLLENL
jgi:HK97 family phage prohead protease